MEKNMSTADRLVRAVVGILIVALIMFNVVNGTLATILGILAGILLLTSLIGICPMYALFKSFKKK